MCRGTATVSRERPQHKGIVQLDWIQEKEILYDRDLDWLAKQNGTTQSSSTWLSTVSRVLRLRHSRAASILGLIVSAAAFIYIVYIVVGTLFFHANELAGYPSMMAVILFLGWGTAAQSGIIGEYVGKIFNGPSSDRSTSLMNTIRATVVRDTTSRRFVVVGVINTMVDFAVLFALVGIGVPRYIWPTSYRPAPPLRQALRATSRLRFGVRVRQRSGKWFRFVIVTLFSIWVIATGIIALLTPLLDTMLHNIYWSLLIAKLWQRLQARSGIMLSTRATCLSRLIARRRLQTVHFVLHWLGMKHRLLIESSVLEDPQRTGVGYFTACLAEAMEKCSDDLRVSYLAQFMGRKRPRSTMVSRAAQRHDLSQLRGIPSDCTQTCLRTACATLIGPAADWILFPNFISGLSWDRPVQPLLSMISAFGASRIRRRKNRRFCSGW